MSENRHSKPVLIPTAPQLFFTKNDSEDPRLGEVFKCALAESQAFKQNDFVLLGYPDDEGIRLNGGRLGASEAPKLIRQFLYKMTPSALSKKQLRAFDLGDLQNKVELAERHQQALELTTSLHERRLRPISLGGGHDYGYSDTAGFVRGYLKSGVKPLVINFDAHLDVRPTHAGFNSGTPFHRLLSEFKNQIAFVEIGLQPQCNSAYHWRWAEQQGAHLFDLDTIEKNGLESLWEHPVFKSLTKKSPVYVSFDIDALTASEAGGCSQAWMTGLKVAPCLKFLRRLYETSDVRGLGIYEVSPPLDRDYQTSKTAALIVHHFLFDNE